MINPKEKSLKKDENPELPSSIENNLPQSHSQIQEQPEVCSAYFDILSESGPSEKDLCSESLYFLKEEVITSDNIPYGFAFDNRSNVSFILSYLGF